MGTGLARGIRRPQLFGWSCPFTRLSLGRRYYPPGYASFSGRLSRYPMQFPFRDDVAHPDSLCGNNECGQRTGDGVAQSLQSSVQCQRLSFRVTQRHAGVKQVLVTRTLEVKILPQIKHLAVPCLPVPGGNGAQPNGFDYVNPPRCWGDFHDVMQSRPRHECLVVMNPHLKAWARQTAATRRGGRSGAARSRSCRQS